MVFRFKSEERKVHHFQCEYAQLKGVIWDSCVAGVIHGHGEHTWWFNRHYMYDRMQDTWDLIEYEESYVCYMFVFTIHLGEF